MNASPQLPSSIAESDTQRLRLLPAEGRIQNQRAILAKSENWKPCPIPSW